MQQQLGRDERFQAVRRIDAGGMGEVWEADDTLLGRRVAIKVLRVDNPDIQDRLAGRVVAEGISVRGLEEIVTVGDLGSGAPSSAARRNKPTGEVPRHSDLTSHCEDDKRSSESQDIGSFIRAQREAAEVSIRQLAERAGVSNPYLSQIERGLRKPSAEVLGQIARGLRLSAEVLYARAGILELKQGSPVRDAILTAPDLTERQREVLVEIYESFRANNATAAAQVVNVP